MRFLKLTVIIIIGLFLTLIIVRACFFDIFNIPSDSMKNTLKQHDHIVINRLLFSSPLAPLLAKCKLLPHLQRYDIVVFGLGPADASYYVKRCIGLPGETVTIDNGVVRINHERATDPMTVCHIHKVWYHRYDSLKISLNKQGLQANDIMQKYPRFVVINLDRGQVAALSHAAGVDSIHQFENDGSVSNLLIDSTYKKHFEVYIPFKGGDVKLDSVVIARYHDLVQQHEGATLAYKQGVCLVNNVKTGYYVFKKDYFLLMGDNRDNSVDSRAFGLVPMEYIEGKVVLKL